MSSFSRSGADGKKFKPPALFWSTPSPVKRAFLGLVHDALLNNRPFDVVVHIVRSSEIVLQSSFPRWRDLSRVERFILEQAAGHAIGINTTLTFNISDGQRSEWMALHGDLTEGFKKEVLHKIRYVFADRLDYWIVVEPKTSVGPLARNYADTPCRPRRFDIHGAVRVPRPLQAHFQHAIFRRVEEITPAPVVSMEALMESGVSGSSPKSYPLFRAGGMARATYIRDAGWCRYATKALGLTMVLHADVVGSMPFGRSRSLTAYAARFYEDLRREAKKVEFPARVEDELLASAVAPGETRRSVIRDAMLHAWIAGSCLRPVASSSPGVASTSSVHA